MSAERAVSSAYPAGHAGRPRPLSRRVRARLAAAAVVIIAAAAASACGAPDPYVFAARPSPDGSRVAAVRVERCEGGWCESLGVGPDARTLEVVATLAPGTERATEVAWSKDGKRVAFLVNGHQLRIYDAATHAPAGQVSLVPADAGPAGRIARGVTFSDNGAAITFDDCPRDRSGCRPGLVAVN